MHLKKLFLTFTAVMSVAAFLPPQITVLAAGSDNVAESTVEQVNAVNKKGKVVCAIENVNIRKSPSEESELFNIVLKNQIIRVLGEKDGYYKIKYGKGYAYVDQNGFVSDDALIEYVKDNPTWFTRNVKITSETANLIDWLSGNVIESASKDETFQLKEVENEFYVVILGEVDDDGNESSKLARIYKGDAKVKYQLSVTNFEGASKVTDEQIDLVDFACSFVGSPYVWGGTDPVTGVDCSGFVQYVYKNFGIDIPRCSWNQAEFGTRVEFDELQPGDLIFYYRGDKIGHVTLYIGDGKVVQARGRNYGVCITDFDYSTPAWAMRVLN